MKILLMITILALLTNCSRHAHRALQSTEPILSPAAASTQMIERASQALIQGDLRTAREQMEGYLAQNPGELKAQVLMAKIIQAEVARDEKNKRKAVEEMNPEELNNEVRTWLERGRTLLSAKQYEQAMWAVEKVFIYDPGNLEASFLIDDIRKNAKVKIGEDDFADLRVIQREIQDRVNRYRQEAGQAIAAHQWGKARLTVQKILLLVPEDPQALNWQSQIESQQKSEAA